MKRNKVRKCVKSLFFCIVLFCIIFMVFVGCASQEQERELDVSLDTMEEPLTIFYDGSGEYLLKSFMSSNPKINIRLIECLPTTDEEIDLQAIIDQNGTPDLIIAGESMSMYLSEWYQKGYITNINEYLSSDETIDIDDYFPETFDVFNVNNRLYAIPLGISVDFMLTSESKFLSSSLVKLEDEYTGRELIETLLEEVQNIKEPGKFFSEVNVMPLDWMYRLNGVTQTDSGIQLDEELFKQVYELAYQNRMIQNDARAYWNTQGKVFSGSTGYAFPCALDPRRYEGNFVVDIGSIEAAPAIVLPYAETAFQYHMEEGIKAIYLPTVDEENNYQARVKIWGAISQKSTKKELAYELLRALMDDENNYFGTLRGVSPEDSNVYPINRTNAISLLDEFENQFSVLTYENNLGSIDRIDVSDEEKVKHEEMLNNISGLYCWTKRLSEIDDIASVYFDAHVSDYTNCYLDILNTLNSQESTGILIDQSESSIIQEEIDAPTEDVRDETAEAKELKEKIKNLEVYDTFYFGETEQDNDLENGAEPIEWIILEKKEDKAFVISKNVIEWLTFCAFYDVRTEGDITISTTNEFTWKLERNQQRAWLTNELYAEGFTENEKELIMETHNVTEDVTILRIWELESDDYLYVPSKKEVETYVDGHLRQANMTPYVAEKAKREQEEAICWAVRNGGENQESRNRLYVLQITEQGEFRDAPTNSLMGVRPVMWLDIK